MTHIKDIGIYLPENSIDNVKQAESLGKNKSFIEKNVGALSLPVMDKSQDTSDLAVKAIESLQDSADLSLNEIKAVVVVTQNPDGHGLPHTSSIVHKKLNMNSDVACFDISLGCSGYVYGLSILKGFMKSCDIDDALLITADPYSKVLDRKDPSTTLLFGDAATATWVSTKGDWEIGSAINNTDGQKSENLEVKNGHLSMNGRQVFNFATSEIPKHIQACLERNNLTEECIDQFLLHQGSKAVVENIAKHFKNPNRFIVDIERTGNTVSSSIPLLLSRNTLYSEARIVIISGFGVGLSWSTNILQKR